MIERSVSKFLHYESTSVGLPRPLSPLCVLAKPNQVQIVIQLLSVCLWVFLFTLQREEVSANSTWALGLSSRLYLSDDVD